LYADGEPTITKETGFSGNGKCSLWMNETGSRPSALHASIGTPWMWTLAYGYHEDRTPTYG
jgi:hypothetical protein